VVVFQVPSRVGKAVSLNESIWHHVLEHPEMKNQLETVKETLANPTKSEKAYMIHQFCYSTSFTRKLQ
jgi:hypothetical protein